MTAGIDFWLIHDGMEAIATRVQGHKPGKSQDLDISTFTIRYARDGSDYTELQKRVDAIRNDWTYPKYTVQAYVGNVEWERTNNSRHIVGGELLNAAYADTEDLIGYTNLGKKGVHIGENNSNETEDFYYVHWLDYDLFFEVEWLRDPSVQGFAPRLKPSFNPLNGRPPRDQSSLIDFSHD